MASAYDVIRRPVISEKNTLLMEHGQYTFEVSRTATKEQVKSAVETIFKVQVVGVNTINVQGKERLKRRRSARALPGRQPAWKKAVVKLAPGQRIEIFEGV